MKLSEALIIRGDLQKKVEQIKVRLFANAKVQEGDTTNENPNDIMLELENTLAELTKIIQQINKTNSIVKDKDKTLSDLLAERDTLSTKIKILQEFLMNSSMKVDRYSNKEIRILSSVDVKSEQKKLDELSKNLRKLDIRIQELNWTNDLIED